VLLFLSRILRRFEVCPRVMFKRRAVVGRQLPFHSLSATENESCRFQSHTSRVALVRMQMLDLLVKIRIPYSIGIRRNSLLKLTPFLSKDS
jgi:hypothetical protein